MGRGEEERDGGDGWGQGQELGARTRKSAMPQCDANVGSVRRVRTRRNGESRPWISALLVRGA